MRYIGITIAFILFQIPFPGKKDDGRINLFYTINYVGDGWNNHRTSLLWTLSYLGAALPDSSLDKAIEWKDSVNFCIHTDQLGFNNKAEAALQEILDSLKRTACYQKFHRADMGQFIALTIGCSWHYYQVTGVPQTLQGMYALHGFSKYKTFAVTNSTVAKHHRVVKYATTSANPANWLWVAEEGEGNVEDGSFEAELFEVMDVMPNGQLRFAIYDKQGSLTAASDAKYGVAGKPAKCLWCHEIVVQPLFMHSKSVPGFISVKEFRDDVVQQNKRLSGYRKKLHSDLSFSNTNDHTQMEIDYISYMQPSATRLMQEWQATNEEVAQLTTGLDTAWHHEFTFLGKLFMRKDADRWNSPYPESIREPNEKEINFFRREKGR